MQERAGNLGSGPARQCRQLFDRLLGRVIGLAWRAPALAGAALDFETGQQGAFPNRRGAQGQPSAVSAEEPPACEPAPDPWLAGAKLCAVLATTTVEIACLKISCSWLLDSRISEYLSKLLMRPESFTPLIR